MWGALRRDPVRRNDRLGAAFVPRLETRHFTVHCSLGRPRAGRGHVVTSQGGMSISEICRTPSFTLWGVFNVLFRTHSPVIYLCSFRNGKKRVFFTVLIQFICSFGSVFFCCLLSIHRNEKKNAPRTRANRVCNGK